MAQTSKQDFQFKVPSRSMELLSDPSETQRPSQLQQMASGYLKQSQSTFYPRSSSPSKPAMPCPASPGSPALYKSAAASSADNILMSHCSADSNWFLYNNTHSFMNIANPNHVTSNTLTQRGTLPFGTSAYPDSNRTKLWSRLLCSTLLAITTGLVAVTLVYFLAKVTQMSTLLILFATLTLFLFVVLNIRSWSTVLVQGYSFVASVPGNVCLMFWVISFLALGPINDSIQQNQMLLQQVSCRPYFRPSSKLKPVEPFLFPVSAQLQ